MDSDDVDIIFENSVLHQALQETGVSIVETEPRNGSRRGRKMPGNKGDKANSFIKKIVHLLSFSWKSSNWRTLFARIFLSSCVVENLHLTYQNRTLKRLLSSPLLCKDDTAFLDLYISHKSRTAVASHAIMRRRRYVSRWQMYIFSLLVLTFGAIHAFLYNDSHPYQPRIYLLGFSSLPYIIGIVVDIFLLTFVPYCLMLLAMKSFNSIKERVWSKILKDIRQADDQLQTFEDAAVELAELTSKCLRYIKESELVAKGFLVARPTSHTGGSLFISDPHHWCPRLRHLLFDGSSGMVKNVKDTVRRIHNSMSMTADFEVLDDSYLQQQDPYFGFLRSFNEDAGGEGGLSQSDETLQIHQEMEVVNNIIPSPKLSALVLLFRLHLSYFIRGLAISFYKEKLEGSKRSDFYLTVVKSIKPFREEIGKFHVALMENHAFYRTSDKATEQNPNRDTFSGNTKGPMQNVYHCINSLDIRLHSAASRAQRLRTAVELKVEEENREIRNSEKLKDRDCGQIMSADKTNFEEILRSIKIDLDLCIGCYDESMRVLHHRERAEAPSPPQPAETSVNQVTASSRNSTSPKVVPLTDPVIVDEVWEATIEGDDEEPHQGDRSRRRYTREEMEQMQQRKEDMKLFMHELNAVVGQRAVVQRQREEVALARTLGLLTEQEPSTEVFVSNLVSNQERNGTGTTFVSLDAEMVEREGVASHYGAYMPEVVSSGTFPLTCNQPVNGLPLTSIVTATEMAATEGDVSKGGNNISESYVSSQVEDSDLCHPSISALPLSQTAVHSHRDLEGGNHPKSRGPSQDKCPPTSSPLKPISPIAGTDNEDEQVVPSGMMDSRVIASGMEVVPGSQVSCSSIPFYNGEDQSNFLRNQLDMSENIRGSSEGVNYLTKSQVFNLDSCLQHTDTLNTVSPAAQKVETVSPTMESSIETVSKTVPCVAMISECMKSVKNEGTVLVAHPPSNSQMDHVLPNAEMDRKLGERSGKVDVSESQVSNLHMSAPTINHSFLPRGDSNERNHAPSTKVANRMKGRIPSSPEVSHHTSNQSADGYSLLAVKLASVENSNTREDMCELLPGAQEKAEALNASKASQQALSNRSPSRGNCQQSSSRRSRSPPPQPFVEGWRSSVQKSKDMHWSMIEKILIENKGPKSVLEEPENEPPEPQNNGHDYSSYVEVSMDDELLFPTENDDDIPQAPNSPTYACSTPKSQIECPTVVNPEEEDFQFINGAWVSRHHFTAREENYILDEALTDLEDSNYFNHGGHQHHSLGSRGLEHPCANPNPNRRRHKAERVESKANQWVNITSLQVINQERGSRYSIIRQKDVDNRDIHFCGDKVGSPNPHSSFNASLALMAASRAHSFNLLPEQHFVGDGDVSETVDYGDGAVGGYPDNRFVEGAIGGSLNQP